MSNFLTNISFSKKLSEKRIKNANKQFGTKTIKRIIGLALFFLGGNREQISKFLNIPKGTLFSLLTRFHRSGVDAFVHQRKSRFRDTQETSPNRMVIPDTALGLELVFGAQKEHIAIPVDNNKLIIKASNRFQYKTLILSFMNSGFLTVKRASALLGLTERHVRTLDKLLQKDDLMALIDKRQGQQKDYIFSEDIKAELIQQYSANIIAGRSTSSREITKQLNEACQCRVSDRSVRYYISKLGLNKIKKTLPHLITEFKKKLHHLANKYPWETMFDSVEKKDLSDAQQKLIQERCQVVALAMANVPKATISVYIERHISTVTRWLNKAKYGEPLQDRPRSGRPATFTELIRLKITAFFCQFNPLPGCNSISFKWASKYFEQNPSFLGCSISTSSISRILRQHSLKPHLHKYFLQITDPKFFDIMPLIIHLYLNPPEYLFSFDECPGIQVLEKIAPPLPPGNGQSGIKYSEPNHHRNGTIDLYAFFDVNTGKVFAEATENHKVETLIQIFRRHVATVSDTAKIYYICDNLSNHSCHEFCRVVAELSGVDYPEKDLDTKEKRQIWLQSENKRIIFYFTPKHGSWLNMVEIWFGILGQKCLKHNSSKKHDELVNYILDFVCTWNCYFAHPFNWTYDGSGLYNQAVKRFIRHITIENKYMELSFLSNQIELMLNMLQKYFDQVNIKYWHLLAETIAEKKNYVQSIIDNSDKPRLKNKVLEILPAFIEVLENKLHLNNKLAA